MHPADQVVFERPFNKLVEEVGREQLVYVGTWEMVRERLRKPGLVGGGNHSEGDYH